VSVVVLADQNKNIKGYFRNLNSADNTSALVGANQVLLKLGEIYREQAGISAQKGLTFPDQRSTMREIEEYLGNLSQEFK
jgi:hypothetical protein